MYENLPKGPLPPPPPKDPTLVEVLAKILDGGLKIGVGRCCGGLLVCLGVQVNKGEGRMDFSISMDSTWLV